MWMNLDQLPAGKSMFTVGVTNAPVDTPEDERYYEEVDVVFNSSASVGTIVTYAMGRPDWPYDENARVIGVSNQSDGYVLQQAWEGIL
jgi:hypothetical protein